MLRDILSGEDAQVKAVQAVVRAADTDILVLAGIDFDLNGIALDAFGDQIGNYPYRFATAPNRGRPSGHDLNGDGRTGGPHDAVGYAHFSGQGGLAVLSRLPIVAGAMHDFTLLPWRNLPGHMALPDEPDNVSLSTTAHWSLPVRLTDGQSLHLMIWHATPPVFDGPEDRNGRRNHDETALWLRYLDGALGKSVPKHFVLAGVANLDPADSDGRNAALKVLLSDPRVTDPLPMSQGGAEAAQDGGVNLHHRGNAALDTVDWDDRPGRPGNLRVDYVLPSATLKVRDAGVFWPSLAASMRGDVERASRHRLVWVDVEVPDRAGQGR